MRANRAGPTRPAPRKQGVGLMNAIQRQKNRPQTAPRPRESPASDPDSTLAAPAPVAASSGTGGVSPVQRAPTADLGASPGQSAELPEQLRRRASPAEPEDAPPVHTQNRKLFGNAQRAKTWVAFTEDVQPMDGPVVEPQQAADDEHVDYPSDARAEGMRANSIGPTRSAPRKQGVGLMNAALALQRQKTRPQTAPRPRESSTSGPDSTAAAPDPVPASSGTGGASPVQRSPTADLGASTGQSSTPTRLPEQLRRRTALMAVDLEDGPSVHTQIRNLFGNGQRVDPKTWVALVENLQHSRQSHMAGHLNEVDQERRKAQQAADDEHVDFLSDARILQVLRNQPATPSTARIKDAQRPAQRRAMSAAFTDRGVRLREGLAAQAIFNRGQHSYEDPGPLRPQDEWTLHPAGQPTHACTHNIVADPSFASNHCYVQADSPGVRKAFEYAQGCAQDHELLFQQSMKRKGRVSKETMEQWKDAKSTRRKTEGGIKKSPEGGNPALLRSGASYVLNPRDEDPPHPHDRICKERKARGEFRYGYSAECHRQAINWNQDLYRFEVLSYGGDGCRALYRAASCPLKSSSSRNPITGQAQDENRTPRRPTEHVQKAREKAGKGVKSLTNHHDLEAEARQSRESRLNTDAQFASLCKAGAELGVRRAAEVSKIKATQFRGLSVNVANALRWDD